MCKLGLVESYCNLRLSDMLAGRDEKEIKQVLSNAFSLLSSEQKAVFKQLSCKRASNGSNATWTLACTLVLSLLLPLSVAPNFLVGLRILLQKVR